VLATIKIPSSEITPEQEYLSRRSFLKRMGIVSSGAMLLAACGNIGISPSVTPNLASPASRSTNTDELGNPLTSFDYVTGYTNYYEFSSSKQLVASYSKDFVTDPWTVAVGGLVNKPKTYDLDSLRKNFPPQERIYRMRCVETWSMVIPWMGFSLSQLLKEVEPKPEAKYVRFEAFYDPKQMPGQNRTEFQWPYVEGLRLDEAMNDLATLATGIYGKDLLPQNGAPIRLVVPWKYGFKSIKAVVHIDLVVDMPTSLWMAASPTEYGFYANVNPKVSHPRWSQATEERIGVQGRRPTELFNGYQKQVASLYQGMDLSKSF
jgi:sulfoxide reductase catalytic subunit YedY